MRMRMMSVISGLIVLAGLAGCSQEGLATEALEALRAEYGESELGYNELRTHFYPQYAEIAGKYGGTKAGLEAELWILQTVRSTDLGDDIEAPSAEDVFEEIFSVYGGSPHLYLVAEQWYMIPAEEVETRFADIIENSPHARVRASAMYALADAGARGDATDEMKQRRADLLTTLIQDYADEAWNETTYGAIATAEMHPHDPADLEVGDRAPEITGWNHDGEEMHLSDYLGKVVVLDFWGDW